MTETILLAAIAVAACLIALPLIGRMARALAARRWHRAPASLRRIGLDMIAAAGPKRRWR